MAVAYEGAIAARLKCLPVTLTSEIIVAFLGRVSWDVRGVHAADTHTRTAKMTLQLVHNARKVQSSVSS
jgi:hypothetical protein